MAICNGSIGGDVWSVWTSYDSSTSTSTGYDLCWSGWNQGTGTTASCTTTASAQGDTVWYTWTSEQPDSIVNISYESAGTDGVYQGWVEEEAKTEEEKAQVRQRDRRIERERLAQQRSSERLAVKVKMKHERAEVKAKELLKDLIGEDEMRVYEETGRVMVHGREYDYILQREGYVKRIGKGKITDLCVHLANRTKYPAEDNIVALKLLAESGEKELNEMANELGRRDIPAQLPKCANG